MNLKSTAKKNIVILILSLLPFIIGLTYSVYKSEDKAYLSTAINLSGSQRMRTMLISNYAQDIYYSKNVSVREKDIELLREEAALYLKTYQALIDGDITLNLSANQFYTIKEELQLIEPMLENYSLSVWSLLENVDDSNAIQEIMKMSMPLKNEFHKITEMYQSENDSLIETQKTVDIIMITFGIFVTVVGLFLTVKIKYQEYHATYDFLTGLKNRHSYFEFTRSNSVKDYSLLFMDLNKFKVINDTYGHDIGDEILVEVTSRLKEIFANEYLYRFGGDEFIALIPKSIDKQFEDSSIINDTINRIKNLLSIEIEDSYSRCHSVGISIGCVSVDVGINDWQEVLVLADDLMYDSKNIPSHVIVYDKPEQYLKRKQFLSKFNKGYDEDLFKLSFHEINEVSSRTVTLFNVTSKVIVDSDEYSAIQFLPVLKRKGFVMDLDYGGLKRLMNEVNFINQNNSTPYGHYIFSIAEESLLHMKHNGILELISSPNFPQNQLIIKIQEAFLVNPDVVKKLEELRSLGCEIALDYSTLVIDLAALDKGKFATYIKIDHLTLNALIGDAGKINIFVEFITLLLKRKKVVILEGISNAKLNELKEKFDRELLENLMYTEELMHCEIS